MTTRRNHADDRPRPCRGGLRLAWIIGVLPIPQAVAAEPSAEPWTVALGDGLSAVAGSWINREILFGVRWRTVLAAVVVLGLAAIADAALRGLVRRKVRRDEAAAAASPEAERRRGLYWLDRGLRAAVPPLALLVWVYGAYAALAVLLVEVEPRAQAEAVLRAAGWLRGVGTLAGLFWLLHRLSRVAEEGLGELSGRSASAWDQVLIPLVGRSVRLMLPLVALVLGIPSLTVSREMQLVLQNAVSLLLIGAVAFVLVQLVQAAEALVVRRFRIDVADNLQARKIHTQVTVLKKVGLVVIGIFTVASMLMVFDSVRQLGTSILASAGIAGIIVGFAAQRSIATLLAGFQIALTQPIRIDDVVIVENEWGRIEDITLTYVTVCIWDLRRLVLPITYFIEQPFQNWTRASADILGSVFLYVDYTVPLAPLRREFERIVEASPHWDGKVKVLQVTDAREHTLELRALASAPDASSAWNLRCEVRERLVEFLQRHHPEALPRLRADLRAVPAAGSAGAA
jgi:small-conductance mechanosensitive channel